MEKSLSLKQLKAIRNVRVRGEAEIAVFVTEAAIANFEQGAAHFDLVFSRPCTGIEIRLDAFPGTLTLRFKNNNNRFSIGKCRQINLEALFYRNGSFTIGDRTSINSCNAVIDNSAIEIGADCMFSHDVLLQSTDQHGMVDMATKAIIERKPGITIADHVWIGKDASICPGISVGRGAIVGMGSVVSKDVGECSAVAGNPAREIRSGVTWSRSSDAVDRDAQNFIRSMELDPRP